MGIVDFLNNLLSGGDSVEITASWTPIATLAVSGKSLWAGDPFIANEEDGHLIKVANGDYVVEAYLKRSSFQRMRVRPVEMQDFLIGSKVAEISTDLATASFCDLQALDKAIAGKHDDFQDVIDGHDFFGAGELKFSMVDDIHIVYMPSGRGDGTFPVYHLLSKGKTVGMEVDFIPDESSD